MKYLLCRSKDIYGKRVAAIGRGFLDNVSEVTQIKLFVMMNFISCTGWYREKTIE